MGHAKKQQHFNIDPDLMRWVSAEAKRRRCSLSQVVRDLILAERERRADAAR